MKCRGGPYQTNLLLSHMGCSEQLSETQSQATVLRKPSYQKCQWRMHLRPGTHALESMSAWNRKRLRSAGPTSANRLASLSSRWHDDIQMSQSSPTFTNVGARNPCDQYMRVYAQVATSPTMATHSPCWMNKDNIV